MHIHVQIFFHFNISTAFLRVVGSTYFGCANFCLRYVPRNSQETEQNKHRKKPVPKHQSVHLTCVHKQVKPNGLSQGKSKTFCHLGCWSTCQVDRDFVKLQDQVGVHETSTVKRGWKGGTKISFLKFKATILFVFFLFKLVPRLPHVFECWWFRWGHDVLLWVRLRSLSWIFTSMSNMKKHFSIIYVCIYINICNCDGHTLGISRLERKQSNSP